MFCATVAVMLFSIFHTTLETPRLWLVFVPPLALGLALMLPSFRNPAPGRLRYFLIIAAFQVTTTCLQWCLFDARESEMRLATGRMFE